MSVLVMGVLLACAQAGLAAELEVFEEDSDSGAGGFFPCQYNGLPNVPVTGKGTPTSVIITPSNQDWNYYSFSTSFESACLDYELEPLWEPGRDGAVIKTSICPYTSCPDSPTCYGKESAIVTANTEGNKTATGTTPSGRAQSGGVVILGVYFMYDNSGGRAPAQKISLKLSQKDCSTGVLTPTPSPGVCDAGGDVSGGAAFVLWLFGVVVGLPLGGVMLWFFHKKKGHFPWPFHSTTDTVPLLPLQSTKEADTYEGGSTSVSKY